MYYNDIIIKAIKLQHKFSNIREHVEETIVQKLGSVLVLKQKKYPSTYC